MRLRQICEQLREIIEATPEELFGPETAHALIQEIDEVHSVYRQVAASKKRGPVPWQVFSFEPFSGLMEPFNVYSDRFWAMLRVHKQPSGIPEMLFHICRTLPSSSTPIVPDLFVAFSHSPRVETIVRQTGKDPISLRLFHKGNLVEVDRSTLAAEDCIPVIAEAFPEGYPEDQIPGLVEHGNQPMLYLGDLHFYNSGRTADRRYLSTFLLNCVAVSLVTHYARDLVRQI